MCKYETISGSRGINAMIWYENDTICIYFSARLLRYFTFALLWAIVVSFSFSPPLFSLLSISASLSPPSLTHPLTHTHAHKHALTLTLTHIPSLYLSLCRAAEERTTLGHCFWLGLDILAVEPRVMAVGIKPKVA